MDKQFIEEQLEEILNECLESYNQDGSIESLTYDENTQKCTVILSTHFVPEDNYIGFSGY